MAAPLSHTTPEPIALHRLLAELADKGVTHAAMEASSHGLDQRRLDGVHLAAAGFTNITRDHLDYHADFEAYFAAKLAPLRARAAAARHGGRQPRRPARAAGPHRSPRRAASAS